MRVVYWARMQLARPQVRAALQAVEGAEVVEVEALPDLLKVLEGAEALVMYDAPPDQARQVVQALGAPGSTVRWMHFLTAGREGFEAVGYPENLAVTHPAGCIAPTVAEHAIALLLALARRVPAILEHQASRDWSRAGVTDHAMSIEGKRMAIVGYGAIGREIARRAKAFGTHTIGLSRSAKADEFLDESATFADLDRILPEADVLMLSAALTPSTRHLFDAGRFALCKRGAILVNVARGGLVDQAALRDALTSGQLGGAGLDVVDPEPLPSEDPLWTAPNLILAPHFAGGGSEASQQRLAESATDNLGRFMRGEELLNRVN